MSSSNLRALYDAIDQGDIGIFRELMLKHPQIEKDRDATDLHSRIVKPGNLLHRACESGQLAIVVLLIAEFKYSVDCQLEEEGYPIHIACRKKRLEIVKYLLTFPDQVNKHITSYSGANPLTLACENRDLNMVKYLVQHGALYEQFVLKIHIFSFISDGAGNTPLSFAQQDKEIVKYLFDKFPLDSTQIPWKELVTSNNASLLEYCTSRCSDSEWKNYGLVYQCAATSKIDAANALLKSGANVNIAVGGWTPLIVAARKRPPSKEMVQLLLEWGADRSSKSSSGKTAQELATGEGNSDIAEMIANFDSASSVPKSPPKKHKTDSFQYATQLEILTQMGFDVEGAKVALLANNGNIEQATNSLLQ